MTSELVHRKVTLFHRMECLVRWALGLTSFVIGGFILLGLSFFLKPLQLDGFLRPWLQVIIYFTGVTLRVHGLEKIDPKKPYLFLFNHFNIFDHLFLYVALHRKLRGVEREDHFNWPLYGRIQRSLGNIPIAPRGRTTAAIESLKQLQRLFEQGVSICIAPEGTRSKDGNLGPFKKGAFYLAIETQAEVVPVVFVGAYEFMRKGAWIFFPRPIDIYVEEPISAKGLTKPDAGALAEKARAAVVARIASATAQQRM